MFRSTVVLLMVLLSAGWASADLVNSPHNMSLPGGEPCAYCHRVHHSIGGLGRPAYMGPLPVIAQVYNSLTLDHDPWLTPDTVNLSDAPLCLTCHDGAFAATNMEDSPEKTEILAKLAANPLVDIGDSALDLRNDHPVGFVFNASLDAGLKNPDNVHVQVRFGPMQNEMWCSTCHDPHDNTYPPLLNMSNEASSLCQQCHLK